MATKKTSEILNRRQAEILKALAHPIRIAILQYLSDRPQCVCDIAKHLGAGQSNISRHLAVMVNAGVLSYRKNGLKVIYKLNMPCAAKFFSCLQSCIKQQAKEKGKLLRAI